MIQTLAIALAFLWAGIVIGGAWNLYASLKESPQ